MLKIRKNSCESLAQWREINKKKKSLHSINQLEQEKNKIIAAIAQHQKMFQENLEHRQSLLNLTQKITTIEQHHKDVATKKNHLLQLELERLNVEQKNLVQLLTLTQAQIAQCTKDEIDVTTDIATQEKELAILEQTPDNVAAHEAQLEKRKATYHHFVSLGNWINSELNGLANKKKLVHKEDDPSCPLCEQNLSASRKKFLKLNFEKQESFLAHRLRRLKRIIPALKDILINQHSYITQCKEILARANTVKIKIIELVAHRTKIINQIAELTAAQTEQRKKVDDYTHAITNKQQEIITHTTYAEQIQDEQ